MRYLVVFNCNLQDFSCWFKTVVPPLPPESKQQSKQWTVTGKSAPKNAKTVFVGWEDDSQMLSASQEIILINYLEQGKTIRGNYYAAMLECLRNERNMAKIGHTKVLYIRTPRIYHHNGKISQIWFWIDSSSTLSPWLGPVLELENLAVWMKFLVNEDVIDAFNDYFAKFDKTYFAGCTKQLETCWTKVCNLLWRPCQ